MTHEPLESHAGVVSLTPEGARSEGPLVDDSRDASLAFRHILVPTDFGGASSRALDLAIEMAEEFGSKVTLIHAHEVPVSYAEGLNWPVDFEAEARQALDEACASAKARYPNVDAVLGRGPAWDLALETARNRGADLVVMGTHGRRGVSRALLGSQAERVVRLSPVPVLTVSEGGERRARPTLSVGSTNVSTA